MNTRLPLLDAFRRRGLVAGAAGLLGAAALAYGDVAPALAGYLAAWLFWLGLSLGALTLFCLSTIVTGGWLLVAQRVLLAAARTVVLCAVLFVPVAVGMGHLFPWMDAAPDAPAQPFLTPAFFLARALAYFALWTGSAWWMGHLSRQQDAGGGPALTARLRHAGTATLVAHTVALLFATTDWVLSLEPGWVSTTFGWLVGAGQMLAASALTIVLVAGLRRRPPLDALVRTRHLHDWGTFLFACTLLWAYLAFVQFLVVWSGDLPREVVWYLHRGAGAWRWLSVGVAAVGFAAPFGILLSRRARRSAAVLGGVAGAVLMAQAAHVLWLVAPSSPVFGWRGAAAWALALVGIGGLWMAFFGWTMARAPFVPLADPRLDALLEPREV